ncbi:MAG TPA: TIM barrel protein [Bryobacteraceae bacterium]|nr:TIM barrel protein [Bryobacteraceae bacterium]
MTDLGKMRISRRTAIAAMTGAAGLARAQKKSLNFTARATPSLCLYSEAVKVDYNDSGPFIQAMGFDGIELAVVPGGHIPLEGDIDLHLERAVEAMTGSGLEVPVLSTTITSVQAKEVQSIMGWGSEMHVPIFSPGQWPRSGDGAASTLRAQREMSMLVQVGNAAHMQIAVHNATPAFVGSSIADLNTAIQPFDKILGFNYDAGFAAAYSGTAPDAANAAFHTALPRLKMLTVRDCKWTKAEDGSQALTQCPLGEGMVDWQQLFTALAKANFIGPITLRVEYSEELSAIRKDLAFLKKQRSAAYEG